MTPMARDRSLARFRIVPRGTVNIQEECKLWMKRVHLPRTNLRRLYVQLKHAFHAIDGSCTYSALINAMQTLMCGCMGADDADRNSPTESLRHAIADLRRDIRRKMGPV